MFSSGPETCIQTENATVNKIDTIPILIEVMIYLGNRH